MSLSPKQSTHIPTPRVANCHMASHWLPLPRPGPGLPDTCEQGARVGFHSSYCVEVVPMEDQYIENRWDSRTAERVG